MLCRLISQSENEVTHFWLNSPPLPHVPPNYNHLFEMRTVSKASDCSFSAQNPKPGLWSFAFVINCIVNQLPTKTCFFPQVFLPTIDLLQSSVKNTICKSTSWIWKESNLSELKVIKDTQKDHLLTEAQIILSKLVFFFIYSAHVFTCKFGIFL